MILIENKRTKEEVLKRKYPGAQIIDVTSKSNSEFVRLSPFFPIGGIPVPFTPGVEAESVEGIWQGLKVFETQGVDPDKFYNRRMTGLKRSGKALGAVLGHQKGLDSDELLAYIDARKAIYEPSYNWMLEHRCQNLILRLKQMSVEGVVVLLDYDTNTDIEDPRRPLSHASLIVKAVERLLTDEEKAAWPAQMEEMKLRAKETAAKHNERMSRWMEMKLAAAVKDNPSCYTPIWVWEQQKKGAKLQFVFFWKEGSERSISKGCLSQWQKCWFEADGIAYNSTEQYMMAEKARLAGDMETCQRIMAADDPELIKQLGREVKGFDQEAWDKHKFDIVVRGNLAKFSQNAKMLDYLRSTGTAILVEASPYDRIWGIGMKEGDKDIENAEKWYGSNLLGFALMVVRDKLTQKA